MSRPDQPYHHGDLRATLLRAAMATIDDKGLAAMSVREVARRAGVSHAAATYHFGDKAGLLTAIAATGYDLLADELSHALQTGSFLDVGVAYVHFAVTNRACFDVMYRPEIYHRDDPVVTRARAVCERLLYGTDEADAAQLEAGVAAWSIVHGIATLWLNGNLPPGLGDDPEAIARLVASHLRPSLRSP